jgi:hypothetical protein
MPCSSNPPLSRFSVSLYVCCKSELHWSLINNTDKLVTYIVNRGVDGFWSVGVQLLRLWMKVRRRRKLFFELHVAFDAF